MEMILSMGILSSAAHKPVIVNFCKKQAKASFLTLATCIMMVWLLNIASLSAQTIQQPKQLATNKVSKQTDPTRSNKSNAIEQHFNRIITNIDSIILSDHHRFKEDPEYLRQFVDDKVLFHWNVDLTLKMLTGSKNWKQFSTSDIKALETRFTETFHRYIRQGMSHYDGQRVKLLKVKLNKKNTRGTITLRVDPVYLPSFNIIFKIARKQSQADTAWQLYDALVEGISYVKVKRNEYRQMIAEQGLNALLTHLDQRNQAAEKKEKTGKKNQAQTSNGSIEANKKMVRKENVSAN